MDDLRWILLTVGVVIVLAVYFWSRSKKQDKFSSYSADVEEVPSFSATEEEGWVDGVSPVRVVAKAEDIHVLDEVPLVDAENINTEDSAVDSSETKSVTTNQTVAEQVELDIPEPEKLASPNESEAEEAEVSDAAETSQENSGAVEVNEKTDEIPTDDVIALYLIVKDQEPLKGESILSAALANHLQYGDMKIFHRKDQNQKTIFSMANMHEPGHFDSANIHKLRTRGVSFFIQLSLCDDPVKALDEMLICAHSMASMLGTHLCDQNRHLLNEAYTRALREKAKHFAD